MTKTLVTTTGLLLVLAAAASQRWAAAAQQAAAPQWKVYQGKYFSFKYPGIMECCRTSSTADSVEAIAYIPGSALPMLGVEFRPGFQNQPSLLVQCAGLDDLLRKEAYKYQSKAAEYNRTIRDEFSKASSTFEGPHPGPIGGRIINISNVTGNGPYKEVSASDVWLNGVLRKNGAFIVEFAAGRIETKAWEIFEEFAKSVRFEGAPLDSGSMCR